jgi:hypothetical protein
MIDVDLGQCGYSGLQLLVGWVCNQWRPSDNLYPNLVKLCVERHDMLVGPGQHKYAVLLARICSAHDDDDRPIMPLELSVRIVRIGNSLGTSVSFSCSNCPHWRWYNSVPAIVACTDLAVKALAYAPAYKLSEFELLDAQLDGLCIAIDALGTSSPPQLDYYHWFSRLIWLLRNAPLPRSVAACRIIVPTVRVLARLHLVKPRRPMATKLSECLLRIMHHAVSQSKKLALCEQQRTANLAVQAGVLDWMERAGTAEFVATYGSVSIRVGQLRSWLDSCKSDHVNHDNHGSGGSGGSGGSDDASAAKRLRKTK